MGQTERTIKTILTLCSFLALQTWFSSNTQPDLSALMKLMSPISSRYTMEWHRQWGWHLIFSVRLKFIYSHPAYPLHSISPYTANYSTFAETICISEAGHFVPENFFCWPDLFSTLISDSHCPHLFHFNITCHEWTNGKRGRQSNAWTYYLLKSI